MASSMLDVEWEACLVEPAHDRELERYARKTVGGIPPMIRYLLPCRWLARALLDLNYGNGRLIHIDLGLAELLALTVSRDNSCRYCYATSRALLRISGKSEMQIRDVEQQLAAAQGESRQAAALAFARRLSRSDPLVNQTDRQALLDAGWGADAIKELVFITAYMIIANRSATITAIPPHELENLPGRWPVRLLRPLIAWSIARHNRSGVAVAAPPPGTTPYDYLVQAYAGLPVAPALQTVLQQAWASPVLSRRCKALLFAVVAHGLGCSRSEREARAILTQESFADTDLEEVLRHLRSPRLDAMESVLVPFARETIWCEPARIQRRARSVRDTLTPEQFLEAVGILALANALCRMGAAIGVSE